MKHSISQRRGFQAEQMAKNYLQNHGLYWLCSNFRCRVGEIDLIMQDHANLVFIEVRMRVSNAFGGAIASISSRKKQKIIKTAYYYLMQQQLLEKISFRFDIVCIDGEPPQFNWIQNAFGATTW